MHESIDQLLLLYALLISLTGQTLLSLFSKRGERVWKLWSGFYDGHINMHGKYNFNQLRG